MKRLFQLLLMYLLLVACNNKPAKNAGSKPGYSNEKLDTVLATSIPIVCKPALFEKAFIKGNQEMSNGVMFELFGFNMGKIKVSSGKIISCDPWLMEEYAKPYKDSFPIGSFPVQLSIAKLKDVELVAFARILFNDQPVVRWRYGMYEFDNQNLAVFTSGIGDGRYANYIGYDANGKICRLLTDFAIFNW